MQIFSAPDVHRLLDYSTLMDALDEAHRGPMPIVERQLLEQGQDGMIVWSAWLPGQAMGVKVMTLFPENRLKPTVQGLFTLFDGDGGAPLAMIDGAALTVRKTAADSGLAARYLAPVDATVLLMVGAGAMAPHLIAAHRAARPSIERVLVWNRTTSRAEKRVAELADPDVIVAPDLPAAVGQAHVISCATRSTEPLIRGEWLQPGCHLDLVGGFTRHMREADDGAILRAAVFVDTRRFTLTECGDLCQPLAAGIISEDHIRGDLFELAQSTVAGRRSVEDITLFKNGGGGHLDLFTAILLRDLAQGLAQNHGGGDGDV